jgi:hypothetical protein
MSFSVCVCVCVCVCEREREREGEKTVWITLHIVHLNVSKVTIITPDLFVLA